MSLLIVSKFGDFCISSYQSWFTLLDGFVKVRQMSVLWFPCHSIFINWRVRVIASHHKTTCCISEISSSVKHVIVQKRTTVLNEPCGCKSLILCRSVNIRVTP
uniref:Uncharacterized protein n=1 Tax=Opuntia streptacantha TaxID=393608 RepID=A0A7C9E9Q2_OPUST